MSYMTINNRRVEFTDEKNVLSVIRKSGIDLPTFCYHSELSTYGACRMCVVEDDRGRIFASCSETPRDKMVIYTNTPRLKPPTAETVRPVRKTVSVSYRNCPDSWASRRCALRTIKSSFRRICLPNVLSETLTNVFYAETA